MKSLILRPNSEKLLFSLLLMKYYKIFESVSVNDSVLINIDHIDNIV